MKRTPLVRRTGLRPVGRKARKLQPARARVVELVRERDKSCQATAVPLYCAGPLDVHEIIPRSAWPAGILEPTNCLLVCRAHHQWIDANPAEAHLLGLHGYSYERPVA